MTFRSIALLALATPALALSALSQTPANLPDAPSITNQVQPPIAPTGPTAVLDTSMGRITCKLYDRQAPITVGNFIGLAEGTKDFTDPTTLKKVRSKPYFDGTIFHRVIPGFMAQGGDPTGTGSGDPGYYFDDEFDPRLTFDVPGRLAMANSGPRTNGSQFFITEVPVPQLNGIHTIFGQCDAQSVQLVTAITHVERSAQDRPITPVVLKHVTIVREGQPMPPLPAGAGAPAASTGRQPKLVGGTVSAPVVLQQVEPELTEAQRRTKIAGTVKLKLWVDERGYPTNVRVTEGLADGLDQKAVEAVERYKFMPAYENGKPVLVEIDQDVTLQTF